MDKSQQYKEIFLAETEESFQSLNKLLTDLEKKPDDKKAIDGLFRITHTIKGNAAGLGFQAIAELSHVIEDLFGEIRENKIELHSDIFNDLFKSIDVLGNLIEALKTDKKVAYKGIKTKLQVIINKNREAQNEATETKPVENIEPPKKEAPKAKKAPAKKPIAKKADSKKSLPKAKTKTTIEKEIEAKEKELEETLKKIAESQGDETKKKEKETSPVDENESIVEKSSTPTADTPSIEIEEVEAEEVTENKITFSDHIQVSVKKLDNLLNLVGELIIERDRLMTQSNGKFSHNEFSRLYRITSDLQYSVMDVRLVQVGFLFNKFHRVVRDTAVIENKKVDLKLTGTDTEIDRNILQIISDSLIHLIRNAIGHGIESPDERTKNNKKDTGTIELKAYNENDSVVIEIKDDGKGIDKEVIRKKAIEKGLVDKATAANLSENEIILYIFEPGFSSMDQITSISGRGVGMDVVKRALDSIGGNINVTTKVGKGTTFKMTLPSSMAVKGTLLFELNAMEYAIPLTHTEAVLSLKKHEIHKVGNGLIASYLDRNISIVFLHDLFETAIDGSGETPILHRSFNEIDDDKQLDIVICSYNNREVGFVVDKLLQQKEIVEKPLMKPVEQVKFISGVTILGTGNVCLVLNIASIMNFVYKNQGRKELA